MKFAFGKKECPNCGAQVDNTFDTCPSCKKGLDDELAKRYSNHIHASQQRQVLLFLVGWAGLYLLQVIVGLGLGLSFRATHPGLSEEALNKAFQEYLTTGGGLFALFGFVYPLLFLITGLILWKDWKQILKSFAKLKPFIAGIAVFAAIIIFQVAYNFAVNGICNACGWKLPEDSGNQQNIKNLISFSPVLSFFILSLLGPFVEEVAYRVGLFGFCSRLGRVLGYILSSLVFAAIHVSWGSIGTDAFISELVWLPSYIFGGVALTFAYDRFGFGCSYFAHFLNNAYSVIAIIITSKK